MVAHHWHEFTIQLTASGDCHDYEAMVIGGELGLGRPGTSFSTLNTAFHEICDECWSKMLVGLG